MNTQVPRVLVRKDAGYWIDTDFYDSRSGITVQERPVVASDVEHDIPDGQMRTLSNFGSQCTQVIPHRCIRSGAVSVIIPKHGIDVYRMSQLNQAASLAAQQFQG